MLPTLQIDAVVMCTDLKIPRFVDKPFSKSTTYYPSWALIITQAFRVASAWEILKVFEVELLRLPIVIHMVTVGYKRCSKWTKLKGKISQSDPNISNYN